MRLYISGPMTGYPEYNYPAFAAARLELLAVGYEVLSLHRVEDPEDPSVLESKLYWLWDELQIPKPTPDAPRALWAWYMRRALAQLLCCDGVALLPGWQDSTGAKCEVNVAQDILGIPVSSLDSWLSSRQPVQVPTRAP